MNRNKTDLPEVKSYQPLYPPGCKLTTQTGTHNGLAAEVYNGEQFTRLSSVTKSDHVNATPWAFHRIEISNPKSVIEFKYGKFREGDPCLANEFQVQWKYDGRCFAPVTPDELLIPSVPKTVTDKVDSIAIVKAQAKLRRAAANLPMLYKERAQSVKTIGTYSRAILNNVITMQRRDVKKWLVAVKKHKNRPDKLKKVANTIADRHLEFIFGVLPLIDDILGLVDHVTEEKRDFRTGRGAMSNVDETQTFSSVLNMTITTKRTVRYSVRAAIRCDIDSTVLNDASRLGFNPIYAWYDMTPLSFVVGWFSNLNHWLQSLDGIPGLHFRTGYSTKRTEINISKTGSGTTTKDNNPPPWQDTFKSIGDINHTGTAIHQNREVMASMPGVQSLYFVDNTSFFAAAASVSLLVQKYVKTAQLEIEAKPFKYRRKKPRYLPPIKYRKV